MGPVGFGSQQFAQKRNYTSYGGPRAKAGGANKVIRESMSGAYKTGGATTFAGKAPVVADNKDKMAGATTQDSCTSGLGGFAVRTQTCNF